MLFLNANTSITKGAIIVVLISMDSFDRSLSGVYEHNIYIMSRSEYFDLRLVKSRNIGFLCGGPI